MATDGLASGSGGGRSRTDALEFGFDECLDDVSTAMNAFAGRGFPRAADGRWNLFLAGGAGALARSLPWPKVR
jgi:hypothetical protein